MEDIGGERVDQIDALLVQAGEAHGRYEETELNGVYDQEWPRWYAAYAVEHGIGDVLGHPVTTDRLAAFLASSNRRPRADRGRAQGAVGHVHGASHRIGALAARESGLP